MIIELMTAKLIHYLELYLKQTYSMNLGNKQQCHLSVITSMKFHGQKIPPTICTGEKNEESMQLKHQFKHLQPNFLS